MKTILLTILILLAASTAQAQGYYQRSSVPGLYIPLVPLPVYIAPSPPISQFSQPGTIRGGSPVRRANVYRGEHSLRWKHLHGQ